MSDVTERANAAIDNKAAVVDFLNPDSMLTPGIAGSLTMMITNVLCAYFVIPVPLTGLAISALFGTLVVVSAGSLLRKSIYYVLNSLIIFCVAMGTGNIAHEFEQKIASNRLALSYVSSAGAQIVPGNGTISEQYIRAVEEITNNPNLTPDEKMQQIADFNMAWNSEQSSESAPKQKSDGFFKPWSVTDK
ncbi:MAG: hypothetical protein OEL78_03745 [Hyphomicrobiales bacterium]|nr:hypothetical protein [Hyphomicrobiales bacterium]